MKKMIFFAAAISVLVLSGCSSKMTCVGKANAIPKDDCHGFMASWKKPYFCRASVYSSDSNDVFLGEQGIRQMELDDKVIVLIPSDALFDPNEVEFKQNAYPILASLAKLLKQYPDKLIQVSAHTDPISSFKQNEKHSTQQAVAVTGYLWTKEIKTAPVSDRVSFLGRGDTQPIATNEKIRGMALNRRIEIVISDPPIEPTQTDASVGAYLKNKKSFRK